MSPLCFTRHTLLTINLLDFVLLNYCINIYYLRFILFVIIINFRLLSTLFFFEWSHLGSKRGLILTINLIIQSPNHTLSFTPIPFLVCIFTYLIVFFLKLWLSFLSLFSDDLVWLDFLHLFKLDYILFHLNPISFNKLCILFHFLYIFILIVAHA